MGGPFVEPEHVIAEALKQIESHLRPPLKVNPRPEGLGLAVNFTKVAFNRGAGKTEAMEPLLNRLQKARTNADFLNSMNTD